MQAGERKASSESVTAAETSNCRALIPLSPVQSREPARNIVRQPAGFLAHLIATEQALPQTRERRRLDPQSATAIYAAALRHGTPVQALARAA